MCEPAYIVFYIFITNKYNEKNCLRRSFLSGLAIVKLFGIDFDGNKFHLFRLFSIAITKKREKNFDKNHISKNYIIATPKCQQTRRKNSNES